MSKAPSKQSYSDRIVNPKTGESVTVKSAAKVLTGGVSDGVEVVELDNGNIKIDVLPTRGMGIRRVRCGGIELKWNSPNRGPVHPKFVPLYDPGGLGWLEGFDEWLVRCGLESNGSPEFDSKGNLRYPLHGRIANLPASSTNLAVNPKTGEITFTGKVYETRLFFKNLELESTISTVAGSSQWTVIDKITNLSAHDAEIVLLYHINTGFPFAVPGSTFSIPFNRMAPRTKASVENLPHWNVLDPETPGSEEVVFFFEPAADANGDCKTVLTRPDGNSALALSFKPEEFPYFAFWKSRLSDKDGYVCGIEPAVNLPNDTSFEKQHGRFVPLKAGESKTFHLTFEILQTADDVKHAVQAVGKIPSKGLIEKVPKGEWTP
ncbi:MAG: aldose 1-epimerase family protein [Planctomycetaceae bacterium]|nr:aldose 1-epimerase family protein [Planctomycetaceae bacterium]